MVREDISDPPTRMLFTNVILITLYLSTFHQFNVCHFFYCSLVIYRYFLYQQYFQCLH